MLSGVVDPLPSFHWGGGGKEGKGSATPDYTAVSTLTMLFQHRTLEYCNCCWLGYSLGTTLRNATQAKRASQGFIGQAERTRRNKMKCNLNLKLHSACPINPWLARFACTVIYVAFVALRKVVPKLYPSHRGRNRIFSTPIQGWKGLDTETGLNIFGCVRSLTRPPFSFGEVKGLATRD